MGWTSILIFPLRTSKFSEYTCGPHLSFQKNSEATSDQNPAGSSIDLVYSSEYLGDKRIIIKGKRNNLEENNNNKSRK